MEYIQWNTYNGKIQCISSALGEAVGWDALAVCAAEVRAAQVGAAVLAVYATEVVEAAELDGAVFCAFFSVTTSPILGNKRQAFLSLLYCIICESVSEGLSVMRNIPIFSINMRQ